MIGKSKNYLIYFVSLLGIFIALSNIPIYMQSIGILPFNHFILTIIITILINLSIIYIRSEIIIDYFVILTITIIIAIYNIQYIIHIDYRQGYIILIEDMARIYIFVTFYIVFVYMNKYNIDPRNIFVLVVVLSVIINIYHFFNPYGIGLKDEVILGRASGMYINPNESGYALIIGTILTISYINPRYKEIFLIFVGVGILITFSRSAILLYTILVLYMLYTTEVNRKILIIETLLILIMIYLFINQFVQYIISLDISITNIMSRIDWFRSGGGIIDYSANERMTLLRKSIYYINNNPIIGHGNDIMSIWNQRPHNMYAYNTLRYGIIGLFIFPIYIFMCAIRHNIIRDKYIIMWIFSMLFIGLFSHNAMESYYLLIYASFVASPASRINDIKDPPVSCLGKPPHAPIIKSSPVYSSCAGLGGPLE